MFYYIDGYNLIFALADTKRSLMHQRKSAITFLQKRFAHLQLRGMLVFDGSHQRNEESGLSYANPLQIAYTPKGQTADEYILEQLEYSHKKSPATVISNDRGLCRKARELGANTQSNEGFLHYLEKKKTKRMIAVPKETPYQINRLIKIFEEKLKESLDF
ncbi:MAG: NYN domain-containing protein [Chlamydiales bacterium]|nr:NYN domain-containing protein [Chlamydiales bacterium]